MTPFASRRALTALTVLLALVAVPPATAQPDLVRDVVEGLLPADADAVAPARVPGRTPNVTMRGSGWGHSVGMSQYGARAQAQAGRSVGQILTHYYPGVTVGTGGSLDPSSETRVELFESRVDGEGARHVRLAARGRNGAAGPSTAATVRLGDDRGVRALPPPEQAWTLTHDGAAYVLHDAAGAPIERGPGPVQLAVAPPGGPNPGLLCLPQLGCSSGSPLGAYQWGYVAVTWDGAAQRMRPILHLPLELYLRGLAEMPSSWEMAALQAQAIAGRTYASRRVRRGGAWHLDATPRTQAYAGWAKEGGPDGSRWVQAVDSTARQVVTYGGSLAETSYSSSHGGRTENVQDSWAFNQSTSTFPYLRSVDDPWSLGGGNPYAAWTATVSNSELVRVVRDETGVEHIASVAVRDRTEGGTPRTLAVHGWTASGERVVRTFTGEKNAGATLRMRWPSRDGQPFVRSQQIRSLSVSPFADDDGSPHEFNIWVIAERGVTQGCDAADPPRYCPTAHVTRAQMATFLARALGLRVDANEPDRFRDIAGNPHRAAINAIAREGISGGCNADGTLFCARNGVTRDQMASFLSRGFNLPGAGDQGFTDVPASSPHRDAINRVAARGITAGCAANRFCPRNVVTRGQMASFLARGLGEGW
ncbi:MAG TPA: SpoIID/LytB domain-containing protein [Egibacteraceae bacterium]|nr:SpoIID/LytB domain-containing protein [Egibacteraceae bacterium]